MKTKTKTIWRRRISAGRKPARTPSSRAAGKPARVRLPVSALKIPAILLESDPLPETPTPDPPASAVEPASNHGLEPSGALLRRDPPASANPPAETGRQEPDAVAPIVLTPAGEPFGTPRRNPGESIQPVEAPPAVAVGGEPTPEARLWLTPRDPYSLLASWTLSTGTGSRHPALWLRVLAAGPNDGRTVEQALPADVSHCFVQVGSGDTGYTAQIGYYADFGRWTALVESVRVRTPADNVSPSPREESSGGGACGGGIICWT